MITLLVRSLFDATFHDSFPNDLYLPLSMTETK